MSSGTPDGQGYLSDTSHSPEAPIRKKRQMSLHGPAVPDQPSPQHEMTRRSSLQPVSASSPQNLQGQLRTAPLLPFRSSTNHLADDIPGPYRSNVLPPLVAQSPPKPLRKDQVYMFEFACENKRLGITLGIGHHDMIFWKSTVQGNGIVYQRKENGDYFQVEELSTEQDFGLRRGDEVLSINGCMLYKYSLDHVGILLAEAASSGQVKLAITRPKRPPSRADYSSSRQSQLSESIESLTSLSTTDQPTTETPPERGEGAQLLSYSEPFDVELYKEEDGKSLGIGIVGGLDAPLGPIGYFIKTVYPNGLVGEDGRLKIGDEILMLNGVPLQGLRHSEAIDRFKLLPSGPVCLTVRSLQAHVAGPAKPSSELKDSSQRFRNSADSHGLGDSSLLGENVGSDSLLDEILVECGNPDKLDANYTEVVTGRTTVPSGNATHSSFLTDTTTDSLLPTVRVTDALTSKIVISQPTPRLGNMSVHNASVGHEAFQSRSVKDLIEVEKEVDSVSGFGIGSVGPYENPLFATSDLMDAKEPELVVKHRVINLYQDPPIATATVDGLGDDGRFSEETDFGAPPPIRPSDVLGSYLSTKSSTATSETTTEYVHPPHEFTSTMFIADDSDDDDNGDDGSRSFQKALGADCNNSMAVAWSGIQDDDFISGIGAPVGFGDDQRENKKEWNGNSKLPSGTHSGTSEPLWKDFDLLGSDPQKSVTDESVFERNVWPNSSHDSLIKMDANTLNPFPDEESFPNSKPFDSFHQEAFNVDAKYGHNKPHGSISDNSLQETLSPYGTGDSPDAEKWFSDESPDLIIAHNLAPKRLLLVGEIELAPPPNFSEVALNGSDGDSVGQHSEEHVSEQYASSGLKGEEDVDTNRFNNYHAQNLTDTTFEKVPYRQVHTITTDSDSNINLIGACVDESNADDWLDACIPPANYDYSASSPKRHIELLHRPETSRLEDSGIVTLSSGGDHEATTLPQSSRFSSSPIHPSPPLLDSSRSESLLEISEPPPLPSTAPPPLPDTPPPPPTVHRYTNDVDAPAWENNLSQEFADDISQGSTSLHDSQLLLLDVPGKDFIPSDSNLGIASQKYGQSSFPSGTDTSLDSAWSSGYSPTGTQPTNNYSQNITNGASTYTEFHGIPAIPKDQGNYSPISLHQPLGGSPLSSQHSEYRTGSSNTTTLASESETISSVAGKPDFLSYSHPVTSENNQVKASRFTERIVRDPECLSTSEDTMSSSESGRNDSTSFFITQTDVAALPRSGNLDKPQQTGDLTSQEAPYRRQKTYADGGAASLVGSAFGNRNGTPTLPLQLDFYAPVAVSPRAVGDQVQLEDENMIRNELEPFQVKVNNTLCGLGMKVSATAKGAVIDDIQRMGPVGRLGSIRVNDYLLAVNGIDIANQTTGKIQEFLNALPTGIVRLTVSALPPAAATSYYQEQYENQRTGGKPAMEQAPHQSGVPSHPLSLQINNVSSPTDDFYEASPTSAPTSASVADSFFVSRRSISRDEVVGSVLKDYYTAEDKPREETSSKPKKPLIAQALLPKSKRTGSLVPSSASSTPDAKTSRSLSSTSSHSEYLDALYPERKQQYEDVINSPVFEESSTNSFPESKDLVAPISSSWSLKTRKLVFEEKDPDQSSTKAQTKPADQFKISGNELQSNVGRYAKSADVFEKDDDDNASVQSDSSSIHSAGYSSQSSENSALSRSRVLAEVETEYLKKVASSKAFFESIQTDSKKAPSSKPSGSRRNESSEALPRSTDLAQSSSIEPKFENNDTQYLVLKSESAAPLRETAVDSENLNIAESKAFFKSIEKSKMQSGRSPSSHGRNLSDNPVQASVSYEVSKLQKESNGFPDVDPRMIHEAEFVSEFQTFGNNISSRAESKQDQFENSDIKLREINDVLDSESINVADSKAFFKSMESSSQYSTRPVSKPAQGLPVTGSKTAMNATAKFDQKSDKYLKPQRNEGRTEEFPKLISSPAAPETRNEKMQEMNQRHPNDETHEAELVKVTDTKAFFESLKPPTSSVNREKMKSMKREESLSHFSDSTAQVTVSSAADLKAKPPTGNPDLSSAAELDKPRAVVQPVFRRGDSTTSVNQHTTGRLPTLPTQKYLPVPSGPLPPRLLPTSSAMLRQPQKSPQSNASAPISSTQQTADALIVQKDISNNSAGAIQSQEQQKSVGNLVSKFATLSPDRKANCTGELKTDYAPHVKREGHSQAKHQYRGTVDSSKSASADVSGSAASIDVVQMKRPMPPSGPPPSVTTPPSQSANPVPVIGSSAKSQKWKQFMTNYSSMK